MKSLGMALAGLGVNGSSVSVLRSVFLDGVVPGVAFAVTTLNTVMLLLWIFWITPAWVRVPAEAYAQRLLEACGSLESARPEPEAGKAT